MSRQATAAKLVKITGKSLGALMRIEEVVKFIEAVEKNDDFSFELENITFQISKEAGTSYTLPNSLLGKNFWV